MREWSSFQLQYVTEQKEKISDSPNDVLKYILKISFQKFVQYLRHHRPTYFESRWYFLALNTIPKSNEKKKNN